MTNTSEESVVVSAKVPKRLKREVERMGVPISDAIRSGLESELKRKRIEELKATLEKVDFSKLTNKQIVRDIRKARDSR